MKNLLDKLMSKKTTPQNLPTYTLPVPQSAGNAGLTLTTSGYASSTVTYPSPGQAGNLSTANANWKSIISSSSPSVMIPGFPYKDPNIMSLSSQGKEIVKLTHEGEVIWANDINVDEAAEAFSKSISLGAELCASVTKNVKSKIRDSVFEEIIEIAKTKGSLTVDELTLMLEASKIMEKLKGV